MVEKYYPAGQWVEYSSVKEEGLVVYFSTAGGPDFPLFYAFICYIFLIFSHFRSAVRLVGGPLAPSMPYLTYGSEHRHMTHPRISAVCASVLWKGVHWYEIMTTSRFASLVGSLLHRFSLAVQFVVVVGGG